MTDVNNCCTNELHLSASYVTIELLSRLEKPFLFDSRLSRIQCNLLDAIFYIETSVFVVHLRARNQTYGSRYILFEKLSKYVNWSEGPQLRVLKPRLPACLFFLILLSRPFLLPNPDQMIMDKFDRLHFSSYSNMLSGSIPKYLFRSFFLLFPSPNFRHKSKIQFWKKNNSNTFYRYNLYFFHSNS